MNLFNFKINGNLNYNDLNLNTKFLEDIKLISDIQDNINLTYLFDLTKDSFIDYYLDNTFITFKSINNNILYLIYSNKYNSIISYNLNDNKKINEIKSAHNYKIKNIRHHLDEINNRDLIISISYRDNNIKLWDIDYFECFLNIKNVNLSGAICSACFLYDNNQNFIISSNHCTFAKDNLIEPIKVFDFKGNKIKEINDSRENTNFIDNYYDKKTNKNYIITCNQGCIKSYDYTENKLYHNYSDIDNDTKIHYSLIINNKNDEINIIESSKDENIRIWNFHSGQLLNKIKINNINIYGICLWNNDYLFVGCEDMTIKIIDINNGIVVKNIDGHNYGITSIKKIIHPKYGECLLSQGYLFDQIKLWKINFKK